METVKEDSIGVFELVNEMKELTSEERERNIQAYQKRKVDSWNKSFCATCPLLAERAERAYLQLGAFSCDDPMDEIHMISRTHPADNIEECDVVNNIYELYSVSKPRVEKLLQLIEENSNLLKLTKGE